MLEADKERLRIVEFLRRVYDCATHGSSNLFERAIDAVEAGDMEDPERVARGGYEK